MDAFIRILSFLIGIGVILLALALVVSFFLIIWPLLAITAAGIIIYTGIRKYMGQDSQDPPSKPGPKKDNKEGIIIEHREDE